MGKIVMSDQILCYYIFKLPQMGIVMRSKHKFFLTNILN